MRNPRCSFNLFLYRTLRVSSGSRAEERVLPGLHNHNARWNEKIREWLSAQLERSSASIRTIDTESARRLETGCTLASP